MNKIDHNKGENMSHYNIRSKILRNTLQSVKNVNKHYSYQMRHDYILTNDFICKQKYQQPFVYGLKIDFAVKIFLVL